MLSELEIEKLYVKLWSDKTQSIWKDGFCEGLQEVLEMTDSECFNLLEKHKG